LWPPRTRTSTVEVCSPPIRSNFWLWARAKLYLGRLGYFADLVRKTVPPWACSKRPARRREAPVKLLLVTEELAFEKVLGYAEQLITTNGLPLRGLCSWMARATSSLPVRSLLDEHGGIRGRHVLDQLVDDLHLGSLPISPPNSAVGSMRARRFPISLRAESPPQRAGVCPGSAR
jgi:hypothetical protein